jgi:large subunit ribosomal protein L25
VQRVALDVELREGTRKGPARKLRARGLVPGIVYGRDVEPVKVQVGSRALERVIETSSNALIDLKGVSALEGKVVLVKEAQRDPVSRRMVHCDFFAVDPRRRIHVDVPLHFEGRPTGVEMGGVLEPLVRDLEVICLPLAIPDSISVDVSELEIGGAIRVRDLTIPEGVEAQLDDSIIVTHVVAPRVEEEPTPEVEEAVEGAPPAEGEEAPAAAAEEAGAGGSDE